ncbi:MAG: phosphate/phosphite/phosphonate ABC transporter substrate-binding protein [Candidatus Scalinduaceae bacterium]
MRKIITIALILFSKFIFYNVVYGHDEFKKNVLTIGKATDKVIKEQKYLEPIITYLSTKLKDVGIEQGEVVLAGNNKEVIEYLKKENLDIILETPFSAYLYKIKANATPILSAWRKDVGEYNSIVFTRKDSEIHRLEDLNGRLIAFEDPGSTSAYFLPKFSMMKEGYDLIEIDSLNSPVPKDKIGYVFLGSELNISNWVFFNKVDAGALSSSDWTDHKDNPAIYRKEFEVIYETMKVPRMLVIVREGLDKKLVKRIKEELLKMDKSEEGRKSLEPFKINKFVELTNDVLKPVEAMLTHTSVKEELY